MSGTTQIDHLFKMCKELKNCSSLVATNDSPMSCSSDCELAAEAPMSPLDKKAQALKQLRETARRRRSRFAH